MEKKFNICVAVGSQIVLDFFVDSEADCRKFIRTAIKGNETVTCCVFETQNNHLVFGKDPESSPWCDECSFWKAYILEITQISNLDNSVKVYTETYQSLAKAKQIKKIYERSLPFGMASREIKIIIEE